MALMLYTKKQTDQVEGLAANVVLAALILVFSLCFITLALFY